MIRVVIDTNVTVSGFLWSGKESDIILACISEDVRNFCSLPMVQELERVLGYHKFGLHPNEMKI
ncbi:MAG: putative toxin-antitoxin system toxin component, PIN family [Candidatus Thermoplasmatota archaeon]|nr:putative toxin-antitoxin system toxin component, PIN family [Candidatus Thermoplasmatota archaeon]